MLEKDAQISPERIKKELIRTYGAIVEHFNVTRRYPWPETIMFSKIVPKGCTVLDLGCGNGRNAIYLAKKGHKVIAVDFCPKMIEVARRNAKKAGLEEKITFIVADVVNLPLNNSLVDAALYIATLHHLPSLEERRESIRELKRVLKGGGLALISVWAIESEDYKKHKRYRVDYMEEGDVLVPWKRQADGRIFYRYYHFFAEEEFRGLVTQENLRIVEFFYHAGNHYALLRKV
ncbi:MAG: hypothetical protein DRN20_05095 [Thermoplasmata archaeon]|nr:MAG: hypothetical protein DRN20_05095 [Thermoplasmata archaeon]